MDVLPTSTDLLISPVAINLGGRQGTFFYHASELARGWDAFKPNIILHEQEVFMLGAGQIAAIAAKRETTLAMFVWDNLPRADIFIAVEFCEVW